MLSADPTLYASRSPQLESIHGADVAQLVEQSIRNRQVIGSSPIVGSRVFNYLAPPDGGACCTLMLLAGDLTATVAHLPRKRFLLNSVRNLDYWG